MTMMTTESIKQKIHDLDRVKVSSNPADYINAYNEAMSLLRFWLGSIEAEEIAFRAKMKGLDND